MSHSDRSDTDHNLLPLTCSRDDELGRTAALTAVLQVPFLSHSELHFVSAIKR